MTHQWKEHPHAYLTRDGKFARFECTACNLNRLEPTTKACGWTFGHRLEIWNGTDTCEEVQAAKKKTKTEQEAEFRRLENAEKT